MNILNLNKLLKEYGLQEFPLDFEEQFNNKNIDTNFINLLKQVDNEDWNPLLFILRFNKEKKLGFKNKDILELINLYPEQLLQFNSEGWNPLIYILRYNKGEELGFNFTDINNIYEKTLSLNIDNGNIKYKKILKSLLTDKNFNTPEEMYLLNLISPKFISFENFTKLFIFNNKKSIKNINNNNNNNIIIYNEEINIIKNNIEKQLALLKSLNIDIKEKTVSFQKILSNYNKDYLLNNDKNILLQKDIFHGFYNLLKENIIELKEKQDIKNKIILKSL